MMAKDERPKHAFNGRLVYDGIMFVVVLTIGVIIYVLAFHPF